MRQPLQNRRLPWVGHLERMEECFWPSKCGKVEGSVRILRDQPRKAWSEVINKKRSGKK